MQNRNIFPFLKLASETRVEIYKHLLASDREIDFVKLPKLRSWNGISSESRHTQILRVSKQIYNETVVILYGYNKFVFYSHQSECRKLSPLRHIRRKHQDLITDITLKTWYPDFGDNGTPTEWTIRAPSTISNPIAMAPFNPLAMWGLSKCTKLRYLTIEMTLAIYEMAKTATRREIDMEKDCPHLKELIKIKGLEALHLIDLVGIPQANPRLSRAKRQLEKILMTELLKPRSGTV
jgi:hypothetical protein